MNMAAATLSLFDDKKRSDSTPQSDTETHFEFLNRVDNPWFAEVRGLLDRWFVRLPAEVRTDVRSRFRTGGDGGLQGAFWEIYLHELFTCLKYELTPHPIVPNSPRKPDYLISGNGVAFYLEATVVVPSEEEAAQERRTAAIREAVNRLQSESFFLEMMVIREGSSAPPTGQLRTGLREWMSGYDPDEVLAAFETTFSAPVYEWEHGDWLIEFSLVPTAPQYRDEPIQRPVGIFSPPGGWIDDVTPLLNSLRAKATKYGQLNLPYLVAISCERPFLGDSDVTQALYGRTRYRIPIGPDGSSPGSVSLSRAPNGLWYGPNGPQNTRVSGVLVASHLRPETITKSVPTLWENPWARDPLTLRLPFPSMRVDPVSRLPTRENTLFDPSAVFGLSPDWPVAGDPW